MATTTTNFGWDIPQSTDLVKDGATAIAALGQDIDTALVDLKGGTTGQVLSKASNTDLDYSWVAVDPLLILDAKGDLITATAADTPARLPVGANGTVLTADSAQGTGLVWTTPASGGLTLLNTGGTSLSGSSTSISITTTGYRYLQIFIENVQAASSGNLMTMRINGDTGSNYAFGITRMASGSVSGISNASASDLAYLISEVTSSSTEQLKGAVAIQVNDPAGTDNHQVFWIGGSGGSTVSGSGVYNASAAITSISFGMGGGTTFSGGTVFVYGVK
jgi:hypothetical protein